jgi:cell wall-associated NlpC family hydrolase
MAPKSQEIMNYGICKITLAPVRNTPSERAEMVTQLLFGDTYTVLDEVKNWLLIRIIYDGYEGWINKIQHTPLSAREHELIHDGIQYVSIDPVAELRKSDSDRLLLTFGSCLPFFDGSKLKLEGEEYLFNGNFTIIGNPSPVNTGQFAMLFINAPYLWGGRSFMGLDCSGFTQIVLKACGISLCRDAHQQAEQGKTIDFIDEAMPGDLAFFDNDEGQIVHTGIILKPGLIIHASGQVRVDSIDHQGIYNNDIQAYTHKLRLIKRLF